VKLTGKNAGYSGLLLDGGSGDDVIFGCSFPEAEQGLNLGRVIARHAGLPDEVPGFEQDSVLRFIRLRHTCDT
jgi:acetyl-CoA acetyltransferase